MTWTELLAFLTFPIGALVIGYAAMRISQRETERFDQKHVRHAHPGE